MNEQRVHLIAASMKQLGQLYPVTLRLVGKKAIIVAGWHRIAAAKELGWTSVLAQYMTVGNAADVRRWQIMENLARAELTVLERAEQVDELRRLTKPKSDEEGQLAPRGGRQPNEKGINRLAKRLGLDKKDIRRCKKIAGLAPNVRREVVRTGLDDDRDKSLAIAGHLEPLRAVREIAERKKAARANRRSEAEKRRRADLASVRNGIRDTKAQRLRLNESLVKLRQQLARVREAEAIEIGTNSVTDEPGEADGNQTSIEEVQPSQDGQRGHEADTKIIFELNAKLLEEFREMDVGSPVRLTGTRQEGPTGELVCIVSQLLRED